MALMRLHTHPLLDHGHVEVNEEAADKLIATVGARIKAGIGSKAPLEIPAIIVGLFTNDMKTIVNSLGGIDATIAAAQKAYNVYVAPIDLPEVPNFIEPTVDHAISYVIGVIIRAAWTALNKINPNEPLVIPAAT